MAGNEFPALFDLSDKSGSHFFEEIYLAMDSSLHGQLLYFLHCFSQMVFTRLEVEVMLVDEEGFRVVVHIHPAVSTGVLLPQQRGQLLLEEFFPVPQRVDDFVRCLLLEVAERSQVTAIEQDQCIFEVEVRQVGDQTHQFLVLLCELLQRRELVSCHFGSPNRTDRKEKHIFFPLFQNVGLDLAERLVAQAVHHVLEQRQPLSYPLALFRQILRQKFHDHLASSYPVQLIDLIDQLQDVSTQGLSGNRFLKSGRYFYIEVLQHLPRAASLFAARLSVAQGLAAEQ